MPFDMKWKKNSIFLPTGYQDATMPGEPYANLINSKCMTKNASCVKYNKLVTSGNNPTITKAMLYSSHVNNSRSRKMTLAQYNLFLQTGKIQ